MIEVIQYTPGMTIEPPCFIEGMPNEVYHSHPEGVSSSGLKLVERSPAHYRYQAARAPSRAMEIGTAIHTALLEPERFATEYVLLKDVKDRRASEYKAATKVHGTERVLVSTEADQVAGMQEAVLSNAAMSKRLNAEGWRELSLFVRDPETGVLVRVRYDLLTVGGIAVDLKSCTDARPEEFSKSIFNYGYDLQAALYADAFEWATGGPLGAFEFAVVEKEMPHGHKLYLPDETMMQEGRRRYREALNLFAECERSGYWPGITCDGPELISLPSWRVAQIENEIEGEIY
jgi:exodeoxyribonuclease VIII